MYTYAHMHKGACVLTRCVYTHVGTYTCVHTASLGQEDGNYGYWYPRGYRRELLAWVQRVLP